jgi:hypothetical protein
VLVREQVLIAVDAQALPDTSTSGDGTPAAMSSLVLLAALAMGFATFVLVLRRGTLAPITNR